MTTADFASYLFFGVLLAVLLYAIYWRMRLYKSLSDVAKTENLQPLKTERVFRTAGRGTGHTDYGTTEHDTKGPAVREGSVEEYNRVFKSDAEDTKVSSKGDADDAKVSSYRVTKGGALPTSTPSLKAANEKLRLWMQMGVTAVVLVTALLIIFLRGDDGEAQKWAFGIVGLILGFWLK